MKSDMEEAFIGTCENCKKEKVKVRRIKATGMFNEPRGFFNMCFECHAEQIEFQSRGKTFFAPKRPRE